MNIPIRVFERTGDKKILLKETDGRSIIKVVKDNKQLIERMVDAISVMFGGGKEGLTDLFQLVEYMEDAKKVYIIIEKEEK
jgi:hypothetical protein